MTERRIRVPSDEYPITIVPTEGRVVVTAGGRVVADSRNALTLTETRHDPIQYVPRADIALDLLERTDTSTYCSFKGDASYYGLIGGRPDIAWSYEEAFPAMAPIEGHLAFYPERVDTIEILAAD